MKLGKDVQSQNMWSETINKEIAQRLEWKEKYGKEYLHKGDTSVKRSKKLAHNFEFKEQPKPVVEPHPSPKQEDEQIVDSNDIISDMHPVTPNVKAKLYDGLSAEGKGRYDYLKTRTSKGPEQKFPFAMTEAQEIGWNQEELVTWGKPKHGRCQVIKSFNRENYIFYNDGEILPV